MRLSEEIELIHGKCNVDLEFFPDRRLQAALIGNDQIIGLTVAVLLRPEIEVTPESALLRVIAGLVSDNLACITDLLPVHVYKVQKIRCSLTIPANSLLLIEVQRENHVADLPAG